MPSLVPLVRSPKRPLHPRNGRPRRAPGVQRHFIAGPAVAAELKVKYPEPACAQLHKFWWWSGLQTLGGEDARPHRFVWTAPSTPTSDRMELLFAAVHESGLGPIAPFRTHALNVAFGAKRTWTDRRP